MKHLNLKSFSLGIGCTILVSSLAITALAVSGAVTFSKINLEVNGTQVAKAGDNYTLDSGVQAPYSITYTDETGGGTTYLPVRKIGELLGAKIGWNAETGSVTVGETTPTKTPDKPAADYSTWTAEEEKAYQEFKGMWDKGDTYSVKTIYNYNGTKSIDDIKSYFKSQNFGYWYKFLLRFADETKLVPSFDHNGVPLFMVRHNVVVYDAVFGVGYQASGEPREKRRLS